MASDQQHGRTKRHILVTGANGFLGRHVLEECLRRGHEVTALVRPAAKLTGTVWSRVRIFRGDLRASRNLAEAFDGVDTLVHLAAAVSGSEDVQFAASVVGTERLLDAMARSQCKRVVLASSFSVYDWSRMRGLATEESPLEPEPDLYERDGYAVAKLWQERVARRAAEEQGWELAVLRPGFIWGKGNEDLAGIGQRVGRIQMVFGPFRKVPVTHVENCAAAFVEAAENPAAVGQTFNVVDDELPSAWGYAGAYLRGSGRGGVRVPVPYFAAMTTARVTMRVIKWVFHGKGKLPSILVPCRFEARFKPGRFTNRKLKETLGWRPALAWRESVERTFPRGGGDSSTSSACDGATAAPRTPEAALSHA
jgi:nucleoside-diphosphate-sugar epimerase